LLRILRERARADESGTRERGGHADGGLTIERIDMMHRLLLAAGLAAWTLGVAACGGDGYGSSLPSGPSNTPPPAGAITINVVGINGNQAFSPNPAMVPTGQTVVWHNMDTTTHRVVLNDGKLDTGNLAPGAFSQPMTLVAPGLTTARFIRRWSAPLSISDATRSRIHAARFTK
jgi:plastocyanin